MSSNLFPFLNQRPQLATNRSASLKPIGSKTKSNLDLERGKKFTDELRGPANKPTPKINRDLKNRVKSASEKAVQESERPAPKMKKSESLKKISRIIGKGKAAASKSEVLSFIMGQLDMVNPESISGIVSGNTFVKEALSENIEGFMQKPTSVLNLISKLGLPDEIKEQAGLLGIDLNEQVTPVQFFKTIGIDPHKVIAQLTKLKNDLTKNGIESYVTTATALQEAKRPIANRSQIKNLAAGLNANKKPNKLKNELDTPIINPLVPNVTPNAVKSNIDSQPANNSQNNLTQTNLIASNNKNFANPISQENQIPANNFLQNIKLDPEVQNSLSAENTLTQSLETQSLQQIKATQESKATTNFEQLNNFKSIKNPVFTDKATANSVNSDPFNDIKSLMNPMQTSKIEVAKEMVTPSVDREGSLEDSIARMQFGINEVKNPNKEIAFNNQLNKNAPENSQLLSETKVQTPENSEKEIQNNLGFVSNNKISNNKIQPTNEKNSKIENSIFNKLEGSIKTVLETNNTEEKAQNQSQDQSNSQKDEGFNENNPSANNLAMMNHNISKKNFQIETKEATEVFETKLANEVIKNAKMIAKNGGGSAVLDLSTPELGQLSLAIQVEDDKVNLRIIAASDKVKAMLSGDLSKLFENLSTQNLQLNEVELSTSDKSMNSDQNNNNNFFAQQEQQQARQEFAQNTKGALGNLANNIKTKTSSFARSMPHLRQSFNQNSQIQVFA